MSVNHKKEERLELHCSTAAKQQIEYAAQLLGSSRSEFIVKAALDEAAKSIEQQTVIRLTVKDSLALAKALQAPLKSNTNTIAAARRYKQKISA
jgi:uncharacterized protein (DUF1778 family)